MSQENMVSVEPQYFPCNRKYDMLYPFGRSTEVVGEVSDELFIFQDVTWQIPGLFTVPIPMDCKVQSPTFYVANAAWCFELCRSKQGEEESESLNLTIKRLQSTVETHDIFFIVSFETINGKKFGSYSSSNIFNMFNFGATVCSIGNELLNNMHSTSTNGSVIAFCQMRTKDNTREACLGEEIDELLEDKTSVSMTDEADEQKVGEVSDELFIFKNITWKIPHVFQLQENMDYVVDSPEFVFADATWCLRMYPNGQTAYGSKHHIDLTIIRLHSDISNHEVSFRMTLRNCSGEIFRSCSSTEKFCTNHSEWGLIHYLEQEELYAEKNSIAPNGTLTVICQMHTKENAEGEACSQPEQVESAEDFNRLVDDFEVLFQNKEGSDVTIRVKGQEFRAHSAILIARSTVFASTFRSKMQENITGIVDVEDCEPDTFSDFLYFLYTSRMVQLSVENVFSLYTTAAIYDVQKLKSECLQFIINSLSVDTFCNTIALSLRHNETKLTNLAINFFGKNVLKIIVTTKWQEFLVDDPIRGNELLIKALTYNKYTVVDHVKEYEVYAKFQTWLDSQEEKPNTVLL